MVDRLRDRRRGGAMVRRIIQGVPEDVIVASAQALYGTSRETYALQAETWQTELYRYAKSVGEYGSVMDWFAAGISRHHLVAGVQRPGLREPEIITDGVPAQLIKSLVDNARGGETQYLWKWGRHLGIGGVGYFIGYNDEDSDGEGTVFDVKTAKEIRRSTQPYRDSRGRLVRSSDNQVERGFDIRVGPNEWKPLPRESLVNRIFRPDDELSYEPTSWSRHALTTLREIDLFNRHIVATLLSRIVFNGFLLIPAEVTFPVNPQFKDAPDPFIAELVAAAAKGIKDPGSPLSALPFPLRVQSNFIEHFKHLVIANGIDEKIVESRQQAITKLSQMLPAPPEAMSGKSNLNHWNAWVDSADNVKYYFGPTMEVLVGGIAEMYLWPMLRSMGHPITDKNGGRFVAWYDPSDLIADPDNSENVRDAYDRAIIKDESLIAGLRLDKDDMASDEERRKIILTSLARQGLPLPDSYFLLFPQDKPEGLTPGMPVMPPTPAAGAADAETGPSGNGGPADRSTAANGDPPAKPDGDGSA